MEFEWNEAKRIANIDKHHLDFADADLLFGGQHFVGLAKTIEAERRWMATGTIDDVHVTAVDTMREEKIRLISLRKARNGERNRFQKLFGR